MNNEKLIVAAARLARMASSDWKIFLEAYRAYCTSITNDLVSSPPETLQVAQGRAKNSHEILRLLESCIADAEKIEKANTNVRSIDRRR